jgi:epoxyqueuosine reductase
MGIGPSPSLIELLEMSEEEFRVRFKRSPVKRAKWAGLRRNAAVALGNIGDSSAIPALIRALNGEPELVRGHAAWALGRLGGPAAVTGLQERMGSETDTWVKEELSHAIAEAERKRDE